jgi:hypothetical protein
MAAFTPDQTPDQTPVTVEVCGPGMLCLAARCTLPARVVVQPEVGVDMHYCLDDASNRLSYYRTQQRNIVYSDGARQIFAADHRQVIA